MTFSHPYLLNLLWCLFGTLGIIAYGMHQRKKIITAYIRPGLRKGIIPGYSPGRRWIKACLILFAAGLGIISLAGPLAGYRWEKVEQKGVDIMIALDCSKSMLAKDIKPDRLTRAKHEIIDLLRMMKSDRAGLVAFAGSAILQCPLTLDHEAFHIFLNVLEPGFLPKGGTNLEAAVRTAFDGFEADADTEKAIILITDGENTQGDVEAVAKEMAERDVKIFTIGVGGLSGAPIPDETGGFIKDKGGRIVMAKVDEAGLKKIAAVTGGAYVRSVAGDMDLDLIYTDKIQGTMERKKLASGKKKVWENRFQWVLFPCVVLLISELLISALKPAGRLPAIVFICLVSHWTVPGSPAFAGTAATVKKGIASFEAGDFEAAEKQFIDAQLNDPDNDTIYYNIGAAAYRNGALQQAENNFKLAARSTDTRLRQNALYNLANTYYRMGKLDDAIKGYEDVLKLSPDDAQARENLEFVRQKKADQEKQKQQKQQPDPKKQEPEHQDQETQGQDKENQAQPPAGKPGTSGNDRADRGDQRDQTTGKNRDKTSEKGDPAEQTPQPGQSNGPAPQDTPLDKNGRNDTAEDGSSRSGERGAAAAAPKQDRPAGQHLDTKLNRLEDKPGRAMMPRNIGTNVEKDW